MIDSKPSCPIDLWSSIRSFWCPFSSLWLLFSLWFWFWSLLLISCNFSTSTWYLVLLLLALRLLDDVAVLHTDALSHFFFKPTALHLSCYCSLSKPASISALASEAAALAAIFADSGLLATIRIGPLKASSRGWQMRLECLPVAQPPRHAMWLGRRGKWKQTRQRAYQMSDPAECSAAHQPNQVAVMAHKWLQLHGFALSGVGDEGEGEAERRANGPLINWSESLPCLTHTANHHRHGAPAAQCSKSS